MKLFLTPLQIISGRLQLHITGRETGSTVDFYAYYPTSISSSITHTAGSVPVLSYTVPDNTADQIDILASSKTGVAGDSYNQTPVDFKHIFAAV